MVNTENIIENISQVIDISRKYNKKCYIHGGYVQDIMEGKLLRKHYNIKMFIEHMDRDIKYYIKLFNDKKYYVEYWEYTNILHLKKDNVRITLTPIIFQEYTAIWKYLGEQGIICFPIEWLDNEYRTFYNLNLYTSGINLEYCYRIMYKYMHPFCPKDKVEKYIKALNYFEEKLIENNIKPYDLFKYIWSYNPIHLKDGFKGYEPPVLVIGKDVAKNHHRVQKSALRITNGNCTPPCSGG